MDIENIELGQLKVPTHKLNKVDKIVALRKGRPTFVDGDKDWEVIYELFVLWYEEYPEQYENFQQSIALIRGELKSSNAIAKEGDSMMQHQLEVPEMFYKMITICYPDQKWDRKFVKGLATRIPILKIADKI
jgi:hypothetical protein